ncbi:MAG: hypothetical protein AABY22_17705 [Nanoarchaeota archaeon]
MKVFIDLGDQTGENTGEGVKEFAFYDTGNDMFESFNGISTFENKEEFLQFYSGNEPERYLRLIPVNWNIKK